MEKQVFKATINATPQKVWEVLWGKETYPQWTTPFSEGSNVKTDWNEGSKVLFLDGEGSGMVSFIEKKKPNEYMSFRHDGMVRKGVEDLESEDVKKWAGAHENYTLKAVDGKTELTVDMDVTEDHKDFFLKTWPTAMEKLKELCESRN